MINLTDHLEGLRAEIFSFAYGWSVRATLMRFGKLAPPGPQALAAEPEGSPPCQVKRPTTYGPSDHHPKTEEPESPGVAHDVYSRDCTSASSGDLAM